MADAQPQADFDPSRIPELQAAANHWTVSSVLTNDGVVSIVLGLVAVGIAGDAMAPGLLRQLVIVSALCMIAAGAWLRYRPQPAGFIVDGLSTSVTGVWMILMSASADSPSALPIYGLIQIVVGIEKLTRFKSFHASWADRPSPETMKAMLDLIDRTFADPERVEFIQQGAVRKTTWTARLERKASIFIASDRTVVFAAREDVEVMRAHKHLTNAQVAATLRIAGRVIHATFEQEPFERLRVWAGAPAVAGVMAHRPPRPPNAFFRARTVYIVFAAWLVACSAFFAMGGNERVPADGRVFIIVMVSAMVVIYGTVIFAIWQAVHWALTRHPIARPRFDA